MVEDTGYYPPDDRLSGKLTPVEPEDTMAEAGRKILLSDFIKMLRQEEGSRLGEDIEHVHDMRVATRRMRSAFRLLEHYYKPGTIRPLMESLKQIARHLGAIRDLDVMIEDLQKVGSAAEREAELKTPAKRSKRAKAAAASAAEAETAETMEAVDESGVEAARADEPGIAEGADPASNVHMLQPVIDRLDKKRHKARKKLIRLLDSDDYADFIQEYATFLTQPGAGAKTIDDHIIAPYQVRHVLPTLLHEHLAAVRAYDTVIDHASATTLHALRIEFKRLRYAVSFFHEVLGSSGDEFVSEIKAIQDHLGRMHDIEVARASLKALIEDENLDAGVIQEYLDRLHAEAEALEKEFPTIWQRFNTRTVQSKLSSALLALR